MFDWIHNIPRAAGHTTAAAESGAIVVCPTLRQKQQVLRMCGGAKAVAFLEVDGEVEHVRRKFTGPVVFDVNTVQIMVSCMNDEIDRLNAKLENVRRAVE